jgi:hypothetical protein
LDEVIPSRSNLTALDALSCDEVEQQQHSVLTFHHAHMSHLQQQRLTRDSGVSVQKRTRKRQQKAFEVVMKQEGQIVRQSIDIVDQPDAAATTQSSRTKTLRKLVAPAAKKIRSIRKKAVSVIPILTPNAAFFQHSPRRDSTNLFNPAIQTAQHAVAWVIPNEEDTNTKAVQQEEKESSVSIDSTPAPVATPIIEPAPILRGLQLVIAHKAQRASHAVATPALITCRRGRAERRDRRQNASLRRV